MIPDDRSFRALLICQFLGAFHDNLFKQAILLYAVYRSGTDRQGLATILFTLPFVLFSSYAGQLNEICSKTSVIRAAKWLELILALMAAFAWWQDSFVMLAAVLFGFGFQSTLFAPSKYGVVPELVPTVKLVAANSWLNATTFAAVIIGTACAGVLISGSRVLPLISASLVIAMLGLWAAAHIRKLPANRREPLSWHPVSRLKYSLTNILKDTSMNHALLANAVFWFSGVWVILIVNHSGKHVWHLNPAQVSGLLVTVAVGVIVGSWLTVVLTRRWSARFSVAVGAITVLFAETSMGLLNVGIPGLLFAAGTGSGLYVIPLLTLLQQKPPLGEKSEVLAAMTFVNYSAMLVAGGLWWVWTSLDLSAQRAWLLLAAALLTSGVMVGRPLWRTFNLSEV